MDDGLDQRVAALERTVTDGEYDLTALADEAETVERLDAVETQVSQLSDRVAELEAATQALRGYVGNIRTVNEDVEQRADAALAKAETLERTVDGTHSAEPDGEWTVENEEPEREATTDISGRQRHDDRSEDTREHCERCGHPRERTQPSTTATSAISDSATGDAASDSAIGDSDLPPQSHGTAGDYHSTQGDHSPVESEERISGEDRPPEQPEETLVPETRETGALQRIRQLL